MAVTSRKWHGRRWLAMIVDLEALVFSGGTAPPVAEQAAYVVIDDAGEEVGAGFFSVRQTMGPRDIAVRFGMSRSAMDAAVEGYCRVTGDRDIVHSMHGEPTWHDVRHHLERTAAACDWVFAKGATLERRLLPGIAMRIVDLEWFGCPRYPARVHDPLAECRFFARFLSPRAK